MLSRSKPLCCFHIPRSCAENGRSGVLSRRDAKSTEKRPSISVRITFSWTSMVNNFSLTSAGQSVCITRTPLQNSSRPKRCFGCFCQTGLPGSACLLQVGGPQKTPGSPRQRTKEKNCKEKLIMAPATVSSKREVQLRRVRSVESRKTTATENNVTYVTGQVCFPRCSCDPEVAQRRCELDLFAYNRILDDDLHWQRAQSIECQ
ncbi:hypothetical protein BD289DRAFT_218255 [Coniella lustricola]|uniref:Uncharacterized protein n=1 Tax=Coniella lustricola TaxID=2025994 RepID=A0A2T3ALF5_9PEZI|nr:hypothetical protein BD289DRAFT_218255 [Coniella lustricola]